MCVFIRTSSIQECSAFSVITVFFKLNFFIKNAKNSRVLMDQEKEDICNSEKVNGAINIYFFKKTFFRKYLF